MDAAGKPTGERDFAEGSKMVPEVNASGAVIADKFYDKTGNLIETDFVDAAGKPTGERIFADGTRLVPVVNASGAVIEIGRAHV